MKRKIIAFCMTILIILACSCNVFAEEFNRDELGSISVTLTEQKQKEPIVGAELSVYYVATVVMDDTGKLIYDYTKDFNDIDVVVDDASLPTALDTFVSQNKVPSIKVVTDDKGVAICEDLPLGLYFVKQTNSVEGFAPCTSFLVTVPNEVEDGYVYDVNASPKTEVARLTTITIKKVWNTSGGTGGTEAVTIDLLRNGNVVRTATLDKDNNWQVIYTDMPESDAYSIKEVNIPKGFTATYKQEGYVFTVTNTSSLIQTGQLMWPIPVLSVCGMIFIAVGVVLLQKKRKSYA